MQNFAVQFGTYAPTLGFLPADTTAVSQDNEDLQSIANTTVALEAFAAAVRQYRINLTEGKTGDPQPVFPSENFTQPPNERPAGIFERIDNYVKRARLAPNYTPEIGAALDIIPSETPANPLGPGGLKPAIKASESVANFQFSVDGTRLGMPAYKVEIRRQGGSTWQQVAFATSNPCLVTVSATTPGQPERILVRATLMKDNEEVGQPSDPTYVTINPQSVGSRQWPVLIGASTTLRFELLRLSECVNGNRCRGCEGS